MSLAAEVFVPYVSPPPPPPKLEQRNHEKINQAAIFPPSSFLFSFFNCFAIRAKQVLKCETLLRDFLCRTAWC